MGVHGIPKRAYLVTGLKTVPTPGTPVPLSDTDLWVHSLVVIADPSNTGIIYCGDSTVHKDTKPVGPIGAGYSLPYAVGPNKFNLNDIYIDATVAGEGVSWEAFQ